MLLHFDARNGLPGDAYQDHHRADSRGKLVHVKQNSFPLSFLKISDCDSVDFAEFLLQHVWRIPFALILCFWGVCVCACVCIIVSLFVIVVSF
jgi:hypothetical protein